MYHIIGSFHLHSYVTYAVNSYVRQKDIHKIIRVTGSDFGFIFLLYRATKGCNNGTVYYDSIMTPSLETVCFQRCQTQSAPNNYLPVADDNSANQYHWTLCQSHKLRRVKSNVKQVSC